MSDNPTPVPPTPTPTPIPIPAPITPDDIITDINNFDPGLLSKAMIYSKTNWGVPLSMMLAWAVTNYGLVLSANNQVIAVFLVGTVATWAFRYITKLPISGIFK